MCPRPTFLGPHDPVSWLAYSRGEEEEEEYDFEYSDEEQEETDVDLENTYYAAKALKAEDPRAAVEAFREASDTSHESSFFSAAGNRSARRRKEFCTRWSNRESWAACAD